MLKKISKFISKYRFKLKRITVRIERPEINDLTSIQEKVIKIVTDILIDPETELHTNPLDNKIYIKKIEDDKFSIFIVISHQERSYGINIVGKNLIKTTDVIEKFHYDVSIPTTAGRVLINKFHKKLKRIVTKMETDIFKENEDNLSDLLTSIKD